MKIGILIRIYEIRWNLVVKLEGIAFLYVNLGWSCQKIFLPPPSFQGHWFPWKPLIVHFYKLDWTLNFSSYAVWIHIQWTWMFSSLRLSHGVAKTKWSVRVLTIHSRVVTICTTRFNFQQFCLLPTQCICVFCVDFKTKSNFFVNRLKVLIFNKLAWFCWLRGTS